MQASIIDKASDRPGKAWWRGRPARYTAGALCALAALYASAINVDWRQVFEAFGRASLPWTVGAIVSVPMTLSLVTLRWGRLVGDVAARGESAGSVRWSRSRVLWDAVVLGQAVNILVPLRFGEGARVAVTSRGLDVPVGRVMVGLALERVFDAAAFAAIITTLALSGLMPQVVRRVLPQAATMVLAIAVVLLFVRFAPTILWWLRRHLPALAPADVWLGKQQAAMREGWTELTRRHQLVSIAVLTTLIPVAAATTNLMVFQSFNLDVPVLTSFVLVVVLQLGTSLVSVPGNLGVFHYLTVVTLAAWGVPESTALAAAIVLHLVSQAPKVVLGVFAVRSRY